MHTTFVFFVLINIVSMCVKNVCIIFVLKLTIGIIMRKCQ